MTENSPATGANQPGTLARVVGLPGAVMLGLGSIVGTGVFVSLGLGAGLAGPYLLFALALAGLLATCNGISSAQLAAAHPVSGGTYEYGYRYLTPWLGFCAGWMFVCAKSASAATAAIGFGGYLLQLVGGTGPSAWQIGLVVVLLVIALTLAGMRRTSFINIIIVSITLAALTLFCLALLPHVQGQHLALSEPPPVSGFLEASALMFVAYTGYGRVATLGEEISNPKKNIPKAVIATLIVSFCIYLAVGAVAIGAAGSSNYFAATQGEAAPLEVIARNMGHPLIAVVLAVGAMTAMLGVLLNLILGLSRVVLAMGRNGDLPRRFEVVSHPRGVPQAATVGVGVIILALVLLGDVKATWSFSAFTVLIYYAITNIAALRLPRPDRIYPRFFSWLGLLGCVSLSVWVDQQAIMLGVALLLAGLFLRVVLKAWLND